MNRDQALSLEREQARHQVGVSSRPPHRFLPEDASDDGGFLQSALVSGCESVDARAEHGQHGVGQRRRQRAGDSPI